LEKGGSWQFAWRRTCRHTRHGTQKCWQQQAFTSVTYIDKYSSPSMSICLWITLWAHSWSLLVHAMKE